MSFIDCVVGKIKTDLLDEDQVTSLRNDYNSLVARYRDSMGSVQAAERAAFEVVNTRAARLREVKIAEVEAILHIAEDHQTSNKVMADAGDESAKTLLDKFRRTPIHIVKERNQKRRLESYVRQRAQMVYTRMNQYSAEAFKMMDDFVDEFVPDFTLRLKKSQIDAIDGVFRSLFEGTTDPDRLSEAVRRGLDWLHGKFKSAGGIIGYVDNYIPTAHNREIIARTKMKDWINFFFDNNLLNLEKMIDRNTGLPFTEEALRRVMERIYKDIKTHGRYTTRSIEDGLEDIPGGDDLYAQRSAHKFFVFSSYDAWSMYNNKYGVGRNGLPRLFMQYVDRMAKDVASLELMGPRPNDWMKFFSRKMHDNGSSATQINAAKGMFAESAGLHDSDLGDLDTVYSKGMDNFNGWERSVHLGTTFLNALTDIPLAMNTALMNGMGPVRVLTDGLKTIPGRYDPQLARLTMVQLDKTSYHSVAGARMAGEKVGGNFTRWLSDFVVERSMLGWWTRHWKGTVARGAYMNFGHWVNTGRSWSSLEPRTRDGLMAVGISEKDWKHILRAQIEWDSDGKIPYLTERNIAHIDSGRNLQDPDRILRSENMVIREEGEGEFAGELSNGREFSIIAEPTGWRLYMNEDDGNVSRKTYLREVDRLKGMIEEEPDPGTKVFLENRLDEINERLNRTQEMGQMFHSREEAEEVARAMQDEVAGKMRTDKYLTADEAEELAAKFGDFVQTMKSVSINEPSALTRAITSGAIFGDARHGTLLRTVSNSAAMYMTWPISVLVRHTLPAIERAKTARGLSRFDQMLLLAVGTTIMGALSTHLGELAKGNTLPEMNWKFWKRAMARGGALGPLGDLLFHDFSNKAIPGPGQQMFVGPIQQLGDDILEAYSLNLDKIVNGEAEDTDFLAALFRIAKSQTPLATMWYLRGPLEAFFFDTVEDFVDDGAARRRRNKERRMIRESDQEFMYRSSGVDPKSLRLNEEVDRAYANMIKKLPKEIREDVLAGGRSEKSQFAKDVEEGRVIAAIAEQADKSALKVLTAKDITRSNPGKFTDVPAGTKPTALTDSEAVQNAVIDLAGEVGSGHKKELKSFKDPVLKQMATDFIRLSLELGEKPELTDVQRSRKERLALQKRLRKITGNKKLVVSMSHVANRAMDFRSKSYSLKNATTIINKMNKKWGNQYMVTIPALDHAGAEHFHIQRLSNKSLYPKAGSKVKVKKDKIFRGKGRKK